MHRETKNNDGNHPCNRAKMEIKISVKGSHFALTPQNPLSTTVWPQLWQHSTTKDANPKPALGGTECLFLFSSHNLPALVFFRYLKLKICRTEKYVPKTLFQRYFLKCLWFIGINLEVRNGNNFTLNLLSFYLEYCRCIWYLYLLLWN